MLNGYVTAEELQMLTGFSAEFMRILLNSGLYHHMLSCEEGELGAISCNYQKRLFNLREVEAWISTHIY